MFSSSLQETTRRIMLKLASLGVFGVSSSGWLQTLADTAARQLDGTPSPSKVKSVILLWQDGGPSHLDTWDLKPDSEFGGEFKPINTNVSGIQISEHLPKLARLMNHGAIIRGMSTGEAEHLRARHLMHTGYKPNQGGLTYPGIGSHVAKKLGDSDFPVPNYVSINSRVVYGAGFLGPRYHPLLVSNPNRGVEALQSIVASTTFERRLGLLDEMERSFYGNHRVDNVRDHMVNYQRAFALMQSKEARAFDLSDEPQAVCEAYGKENFQLGCLMARRLVEVGIPFVEVTLDGWDTHNDNFNRLKSKLLPVFEGGAAALITDLKERGLLESTLVVLMGEFGRTPFINTRDGRSPGRDHFGRAWSTALFGGGIKGGTVHGRTNADGGQVEEGKTSAGDFLATVYKILGIDYTKEHDTPSKRPISIVEAGAKPVESIIA